MGAGRRKVDIGETLEGALVREIFEETGLAVEPASEFIVSAQRVIVDGSHYHGLLYLSLTCLVRVIGGEFIRSHEHCDDALLNYSAASTLHPSTAETTTALKSFRAQLEEITRGFCHA